MSYQAQSARKESRSTSYNTINVEQKNSIAIITLNRPQVHNALSRELTSELRDAIEDLEYNNNVRAIVLTGGEKVFAAGADIKEIADKNYAEAYTEDYITTTWEKIAQCRKPIIAAVAGHALGGGCEIAMMCDIIIAADNAEFGQPEITIGTIPGCGGTQRLTRIIGKAKAMDICLTGRTINAQEAERAGLVSRVVPASKLINEAISAAQKIAEHSQPIAYMIKESINRSYETTLSEGIRFERRLFQSTFAIQDQKEGMRAFIDKRKPKFRDN